jgi:ATP-dependent Lon protease
MLDEVDKLGADFRGDPASALLEVLDPEQNSTYVDHYLEVPFDLSKVLFICTANFLDPVPPALKDRMEVLEFPGYTEEEKLHIARRYLVPQQIERAGLQEDQFGATEEALRSLINEYTREAGVRNLERQIASLCRKAAKRIATGETPEQKIERDQVVEMLGPPKFIPEVAERVSEPGVAAGLAWTPTGGDIIFVETTMTPGEGKLILTGMLGDVMKESAQAALTYVRAHSDQFDVDPELFQEHDFHIHVPAGAIPKDGPSAGVTMAVALGSLCSGRRVHHDVAMTGEITLRGKVLPVGGIKEKVLAACRAGISKVIVPERNEKDLAGVPDYAKEKLDFVAVDKVDDIFPVALEAEKADAAATT